MGYFTTILISGFILLLGLGGLIFGIYWLRSDEMTPRLRSYIVEEDVTARKVMGKYSMPSREMTGSLSNRLVMPFLKKFGSFFSRYKPRKAIEDLRFQLNIAGNPLGIGPIEYYGVRLAFIVVGLGALFVLIRNNFNKTYVLVGVLVLFVCYIFPILWLRLTISSQQKKLQKDLPSALDMLSVCVDAGLGFDQALQRVSEQWNTRIAAEFGRVVTEMEMGLSRKDALRNMANRFDITELSSFVAIIIQSEQLGSSIADVLHVQADQMRVERRYRAQEKARTVPIKMLIPLAFLIFPAIMAVLIGPAIPPLLQLFK